MRANGRAALPEITVADVKQLLELYVYPRKAVLLEGQVARLVKNLNEARQNIETDRARRRAAFDHGEFQEALSRAALSIKGVRVWIGENAGASARRKHEDLLLANLETDLARAITMANEITIGGMGRHNDEWPRVLVGLYIQFALTFGLKDFGEYSRTTPFARFASAAVPLVTGEDAPGPGAIERMMVRIGPKTGSGF